VDGEREVGVIAFGVRTTLCVFESPMCEGAANFSAGIKVDFTGRLHGTLRNA
jgi:hypothetical protein